MAISATATSILALSAESSKPASPFSTTKLSSLTSLKLSAHFHRLTIRTRGSASSAPRHAFAPLVKAEKQTFANLDELLEKSDKPLLVDFYATWCGPCQFMTPILNEVGSSLKDKVQVVKIDTEKYPSIADKYQIQALPTFIIFKDGKPCDRFEGALTAKQLIQRIENALKVKQ
uniref:Thioredoxin domain-containing protein n=1 Tax=Kalanchoe fedtschenkoi TaxID=63787 RepID=A0A7N0TA46_KALFE